MLKKIRRNVNSNIELKYFTRRIINYWNNLRDVVVSCKSLSTFKIKLDEFMTAKGKFKFIVVQLMHDSFLLLVLFLYNQLGSWLRLSRQSWVDSKIYMVFTFILNPSFIDMTFQVKHLMIGHVLDVGLFIQIDSSRVFFF